MLLDFLSNLPHLSFWQVITVFFLVLMRLSPILAMAPFLSAKLGPSIGRIGLGVCLAILFLPYLVVNVRSSLIFDSLFILLALKELLIGFFIGFFITVPFYIVQSSGIIVDYLRGSSIMQAQDPTLQSQASPIGIFYNAVLIFIFFQIDGPLLFFDALLKSYMLIPVDGLINVHFFTSLNPFWELSLSLLHQVVSLALQLSAPILVAILMAEMFLGIANRLAPQVQIAFLGMSIKSLLGLTLLWVSWFFILKQFTKQAHAWIQITEKLALYMQSTPS